MFTLPNVTTTFAIEADGMALVSTGDPRIRAVVKKHKSFATYMRAFKTEFDTGVAPSFIICRPDMAARFRTVEAIASFRDVIALSIIPSSWAINYKYGTLRGIPYANWFSVYPWTLDKHYQDIVSLTLAQHALHSVDHLRPQSTAGISPAALNPLDIDQPLLNALLKRWHKFYGARRPTKEDRALFRSLNMAHQAALLPAMVDATIYDIGRALSLWVSACEILVHPKNNHSGYPQVYEHLDSANWLSKGCKEKKYKVFGKKQPRRSLPCWLYGQINHARNDFLHGNPIGPSRLTIKRSNRQLPGYASLIYRMALAATLDLKFKTKVPSKLRPKALAAWMSKRMDFNESQELIEAGLRTSLRPRTPSRRNS